MKLKKQRIMVVATIVVAAALLLFLRPSEPSYHGQPISKWFYRAWNFDSPLDSAPDREAFRAMGREAIPFLVRRLEDAPSERVKGLLSTVWSTGSEIYRQRKQMWQHRAAFLLGEMGTAAESAEPNLTNAAASGEWSLRGAAAVALIKIRQQPIEPLIEKLSDTSDCGAWYEQAMMVGQFGWRAEPAIPILLGALRHTNNTIQAHALIALGMIARQPDKCIPAILPFVSSPNVGDRQKAMAALLSFGTNALPGKKAIQGALTDSDPWVRKWAEIAMKTLEQIERPKAEAESAEPDDPAPNGNQPIRAETNSTSSAAGSRR